MSALDLTHLERVFVDDERVRFAYVFGSVADGTDRQGSDVDLAVSVRPRGTMFDDARLHDALIAALGREDVDLVMLQDAPLWLAHRVVAGRVVFSRDDVGRVRHRAAVEREFLDFQPFHDRYLAAIHDRARSGRLSRG